MTRASFIAALVLACSFAQVRAEIRVVDDNGQTVVLPAPARRIISLAPHVTETLFEAGAGDRIVGTVKFADYPEAAKKIQRVGDSALLDMERIVALKPDLIVVWLHGNSEKHLIRLRTLGILMFHSRPRTLADIPSSLIRMGQMAGTEAQAREAAFRYATQLEELQRRYADRPTVSVFFQVWKKPLLTINGDQIISDAIRLCGGRNVFEEAKLLVPTVDVEGVASADPEAIVATGTVAPEEDKFDLWRKLPSLRATASNNLILLRTETLSRHSPRILEGVSLLCRELEGVRSRRRS